MAKSIPYALGVGCLLLAVAAYSSIAQEPQTPADQPAAESTQPAAANVGPALKFSMKTLLGDKTINFAEKYKGKVVLFVNVASYCGNTPQYKVLQVLNEKYAEKGLAVVGIPCNQFGGQEPGTAEEIAAFCEETYHVKFDMLEKSDVNGDKATALYKFLTSRETNPKFAGPITWNFEKFLVDRQGNVVARYAPKLVPDDPEVIKAIETELAKEQPAEKEKVKQVTPAAATSAG